MKPVIGIGVPELRERRGAWLQHFPGGKGQNNCPRFWYVRDGFGCTFRCRYCYLQRFEHTHDGAELNPNVAGLYREVTAWLKRPGALGLLIGEVTDAWGWAKSTPFVLTRNLALIDLFRPSSDKTLIFLTKAAFVTELLRDVAPTPQVVLSWSVQAPEVATEYEMGSTQAQQRLHDALRARRAGWRVRLRLDPMIPIDGWADAYHRLAERIIEVAPEQVTLGSWRPRPRDSMYRDAPPALRARLEPGWDGRMRLRDRLAMYEFVATRLRRAVPELSLCKEEFDVQALLYARLGITQQACNCLSAAVPMVAPDGRRHLPLIGVRP